MDYPLPYSSWFFQHDRLEPCHGGVPLADRGFRYGQHLFETIAVRAGRVFLFEEHWKSLEAAARRHAFPTVEAWYFAMKQFLKEHSFQDGILRIFITAGEGLPAAPIVAPRLFVFWEAARFPSAEKRKQGITIVSLDAPVGTVRWGEKTGNYVEHLNALEIARHAGVEEGLIFDCDGYLISAAMANVVLWLDDGRIITPPPVRGARMGVTLGRLRQQIPEIVEADMMRIELNNVRALVVTNARLGVMPVSKLDGIKLSLELFSFRDIALL